MMFSNNWRKSIVVVATITTILKPTTAVFNDVIRSIGSALVNTCQYTGCENHPRCAVGYDTFSTTGDGCSGLKEKKYCCQSGMGPQCFHTGCGKTSCPSNYRELDRSKNGCSGLSVNNVYCCKTTNLPHCFDMSCPDFSESAKHCPQDYREMTRAKGRSGGCDSSFAERLTCCIRGDNYGNNGNQNVNGNSDTEVISETKTIKLEDGSLQTITTTHTRSSSRGGIFSNSHMTFAAFFRILLLPPIVVALL